MTATSGAGNRTQIGFRIATDPWLSLTEAALGALAGTVAEVSMLGEPPAQMKVLGAERYVDEALGAGVWLTVEPA